MKDAMYSMDLTDVTWQKSSFSNPHNCLEVAQVAGGVAVRDSKNPDRVPLMFDEGEWQAFVAGAAAGEFG